MREARRSADREIERSAVPSLRVAWRAAELVTPTRRLDLARSLRRLVHEADPRYLPSAAPISRVSVRISADLLLGTAARLDDLERPISARGVLMLDRLLIDGSSPLYDLGPADALIKALEAAAAALEPNQ
jgi:hypothetical protein